MAKVKKEVVEAAILKFIDQVAATMPSTSYKFMLGGATALMTIGGQGKAIDNFLTQVSDEEGYIEIEKAKAIADAGFRQSGGKIQLDLFNDKSSLLSLFLKPITLTVTKSDIDAIFKEIEDNAIKNVSLSQPQAIGHG